MKQVEIYDPAMCCPTGVCGVSVDPDLIRLATVLNALKEKGLVVKRYGLSTEPQSFVANSVISALLQKEGADVLPVTLVDGVVTKTKVYPTNEELAEWLETEISIKTPLVFGMSSGPSGCC